MYNYRESYGKAIVIVNVLLAMLFLLAIGAWASNLINLLNVVEVVTTVHSADLRLAILAAGSLLFLVDFLYLKRWFFDRHKRQLVLGTEAGAVLISFSAIEASLERSARRLPEIHDVRVAIRKEKGRELSPRIRVVYSTWENNVVRDVSYKMQAALKIRYEQIAGAEATPVFEMYLVKIASKEKKNISRETSEPEAPHFIGPRYPIEDDGA
ncbi:MAG: hypothetical protein A2Z34_00530 [Planctomycetes bacterium RBG_16_59_8]|nr:MAG: hypothetical protein A2Z34_00530 [Planctomycetes bacterium RBG_16_59_8]